MGGRDVHLEGAGAVADRDLDAAQHRRLETDGGLLGVLAELELQAVTERFLQGLAPGRRRAGQGHGVGRALGVARGGGGHADRVGGAAFERKGSAILRGFVAGGERLGWQGGGRRCSSRSSSRGSSRGSAACRQGGDRALGESGDGRRRGFAVGRRRRLLGCRQARHAGQRGDDRGQRRLRDRHQRQVHRHRAQQGRVGTGLLFLGGGLGVGDDGGAIGGLRGSLFQAEPLGKGERRLRRGRLAGVKRRLARVGGACIDALGRGHVACSRRCGPGLCGRPVRVIESQVHSWYPVESVSLASA